MKIEIPTKGLKSGFDELQACNKSSAFGSTIMKKIIIPYNKSAVQCSIFNGTWQSNYTLSNVSFMLLGVYSITQLISV